MARVALQLIIFGKRVQQDLAGVLRAVRSLGYDAAETGMLASVMPAAEQKRIMADLGLLHAGVHMGFGNIADIEPVLDYVQAVGADMLYCSGVGDHRTEAAYHKAAEIFNAAAQKVAARNVSFLYHNHSFEFVRFGRRSGMDMLIAETDPRAVWFCFDTCWLKHGGEEPAEYIRRHGRRMLACHLKDLADATAVRPLFKGVGEGILDWPAILKALAETPARWHTVEQDSSEHTPEEASRISREFLRKHGL